jgi:hypothetical protein
MVEVKQMPYAEKYSRALDALKHDEYMLPFVEEHLGQAALAEYRRMIQSAIEPIPEEASPEVKYEIAFGNWMRECRAIYRFIRERMGDEGIEQMATASVEALKREDSRLSLYLLRMIRAISPGLAFGMVVKQLAYEFQWLSPYFVDELSRQRGSFTLPRCKILDYPDNEDTCRVACQGEYPRWLAEQFKVKMESARQGNRCTVTFTPLTEAGTSSSRH